VWLSDMRRNALRELRPARAVFVMGFTHPTVEFVVDFAGLAVWVERSATHHPCITAMARIVHVAASIGEL